MNKLIKQFAKAIGLNVSYYKKTQLGDFHYETVSPIATLAPWNKDKTFHEVYDSISANTMVDIYRCYELWSLIKQVEKLNDVGDYLEVGVWRGGTSVLMATQLKQIGSKSNLYAADTFKGVIKVTDSDTSYKVGEHNDTSIKIVNELMTALNLNNIKILEGIFPDDTAYLIPEGVKFKLCHIDVDIYQSAKDIVEYIWKRLMVGGIIVYDDYGFITCDGITKLVEEQQHLTDRLILHNLNGHAVIIKLR